MKTTRLPVLLGLLLAYSYASVLHAEPPARATGATKTTPAPSARGGGGVGGVVGFSMRPPAHVPPEASALPSPAAPSAAQNLALRKRLARGERLTTPSPPVLKGLSELHAQP